MSIRVMKRVWATKILPAGRKLVAMKLADACNDHGGSLFPSMASIAADCNLSRAQAQRHMHSLINDGLLSVVSNANGGAPGTVPHYQLHVDRLAQPKPPRGSIYATPTGDMDATGSAGATGRMDAADGSRGCTGGVALMQPTGSTGATQPTTTHQVITKKPKKISTSKKFALPDDFAISEQVRAWSTVKGFTDLDSHLEHFVGYAKARGAMYADWDQAFMNAIRGNWAKVARMRSGEREQPAASNGRGGSSPGRQTLYDRRAATLSGLADTGEFHANRYDCILDIEAHLVAA